MKKVIIFIGAPASGKGTRIDELEEYYKISTSLILRKNNLDLSKGDLINDDIVNSLILNEIKNALLDNIVLDGYPRTINQLNFLISNNIYIETVYNIIAPNDIVISRAANRLTCLNCQSSYTIDDFRRPQKEGICDKCGGILIRRPDDEPNLVIKRIKKYYDSTYCLLNEFDKLGINVIDIDSSKSPKEIKKYIKR